jgi:hypothetical protein
VASYSLLRMLRAKTSATWSTTLFDG